MGSWCSSCCVQEARGEKTGASWCRDSATNCWAKAERHAGHGILILDQNGSSLGSICYPQQGFTLACRGVHGYKVRLAMSESMSSMVLAEACLHGEEDHAISPCTWSCIRKGRNRASHGLAETVCMLEHVGNGLVRS